MKRGSKQAVLTRKYQPIPQQCPSRGISHTAATQDADDNIYAEVDVSPVDMSYFPQKYPQLKMVDLHMAPSAIRVIYSRPHLQGRKLFEEGFKIWRHLALGANEATELNTFQTVTIGGKKIPRTIHYVRHPKGRLLDNCA